MERKDVKTHDNVEQAYCRMESYEWTQWYNHFITIYYYKLAVRKRQDYVYGKWKYSKTWKI